MFRSVVRGDADLESDVDLLVDMGDRRSLFEHAALQGDLEDLLECRVQVTATGD